MLLMFMLRIYVPNGRWVTQAVKSKVKGRSGRRRAQWYEGDSL